MFNTVLIANRGEIACRAIRTLKRLGITSVAVFSDADRNALHVKEADVALSLGGESASESYLRIDKLIDAARRSGAEAIWPGYGFLSESPVFAEACEAAGIVFVGPTPQQLSEFGLKHRARALAAAANVPMAPGTALLATVEDALRAADEIGYPVMLKSTAGGGGIGLIRCGDAAALRNAWESVRRLGAQFFNDAGVFIERCIDHARHIEVQLLGDGKGTVVALGERDCSLQRRNQKVIEETPAPHLPHTTRHALHTAAVALGQQVNYRSAGTVEFIYDANIDAFYFLEMNTRLQVEHPVTESVTGIDLVECMLRIAANDPIDWQALRQPPHGAAIEVRFYAENPLKQYQPSPGVLTHVAFPDHVRVDSGVVSGSEVSALYDPMIAKLIATGPTRAAALGQLREALEATQLHGIATNLDYLRHIVATEAFQQGRVWTHMLDTLTPPTTAIEVLQPGTWSSVQDYPGRLGYWHIGVPPSGPMDDMAFRLANRIVGNDASAAGLEFTLQGPTLQFHCDATIALTGAACPAQLDGDDAPFWQPIHVSAGQILTLGRAQSGCRTYLAVRNGLDVPRYLGSRSTFALGQFGGHAGRTLRVADLLPISVPERTGCTTPPPVSQPQPLPAALIPAYGNEWSIGVLYGPHAAPDFFTEEAIDTFFNSEWSVHYNANRLGVRLSGPKPQWARPNGGEAGMHPSNLHDCEYAIGAINFTGDFPVIITRDGPSLGGFVCPVTVADAELWKVGQLKPGDRIRFHLLSSAEATSRRQAYERMVETLAPVTSASLSVPLPSGVKSPPSALLASLAATDSTPTTVLRQAGDRYILIEYGDDVLDLASRLRVHLLMAHLTALAHPGIEELSPGVRSLQVRYDNLLISQTALVALLLEAEHCLGDVRKMSVPSRIVHLPLAFEDSATLEAVNRYRDTVCADAPWLPNNVDFIQRINGLPDRQAVRQTLFDARYLVLGLGDVYLGAPCAVPLDPRHRLLSSKYNPARTFTAEGTVGIGGMYMCIYGMDSPGGYQLVGRTLPIWNKFATNLQFGKTQPWLLRFFDQVQFYPVTEEALNTLREDFREGRASIEIEETLFDFADYQQFLTQHSEDIEAFRQRQAAAFNAEVERWQHAPSASVIPAPANADEDDDDGAQAIQADMHGNVWKVLVAAGDSVDAGQPLMIVEAMKMELEVTAPRAGRVMRIRCQPGHQVSPGDPLLWLDDSVD